MCIYFYFPHISSTLDISPYKPKKKKKTFLRAKKEKKKRKNKQTNFAILALAESVFERFRVYLDTVYFAKIEKLLLKIL